MHMPYGDQHDLFVLRWQSFAILVGNFYCPCAICGEGFTVLDAMESFMTVLFVLFVLLTCADPRECSPIL